MSRERAKELRSADDAELIRAVIERDNAAWDELLRRYSEQLRQELRDAYEFSGSQIDDVLGDLWVHLLDNGMRRLKLFAERAGSVAAFLTMHASQVAEKHAARLRKESTHVAFDETTYVAPPMPPRSRTPITPHHDISGLAALLQLPIEVQALRSEVSGLRSALDQLRRALPPALLSVGDAARSMGVSEITVRRMVKSGRLAHVRVGRCVKVDLTRTPVESVNASDGRRLAIDLDHR